MSHTKTTAQAAAKATTKYALNHTVLGHHVAGDYSAPARALHSASGQASSALLASQAPRFAQSSQASSALRGNKGRAVRILLGVIGLLLGFAMIVYPYISDYAHKRAAANIVVTQQSAIAKTNPAILHEQMRKAMEYNAQLAQGRAHITDPFDEHSASQFDKVYISLLNLNGDGVMATVVIPKLNIRLPIYHTTEQSVLERGVGHMSSTSLPVGGASTHTALAGHNGLPSMKIFDDIDTLRNGDEFAIEVLGEEHVYRVYATETTLPSDTSSLHIQPGKDLVTLITCTPYGVNTHRLLVHAQRIAGWTGNNATKAKQTTGTPTAHDSLLTFTLIGITIALGLVLSLLLGFLRKKRRKSRQLIERSDTESLQ